VKVSYAGKPVLEIEGDISLSEDPSITFGFVPEGPASMDVAVEDQPGAH
jgi:sulfur-oxidizing protein SoxY